MRTPTFIFLNVIVLGSCGGAEPPPTTGVGESENTGEPDSPYKTELQAEEASWFKGDKTDCDGWKKRYTDPEVPLCMTYNPYHAQEAAYFIGTEDGGEGRYHFNEWIQNPFLPGDQIFFTQNDFDNARLPRYIRPTSPSPQAPPSGEKPNFQAVWFSAAGSPKAPGQPGKEPVAIAKDMLPNGKGSVRMMMAPLKVVPERTPKRYDDGGENVFLLGGMFPKWVARVDSWLEERYQGYKDASPETRQAVVSRILLSPDNFGNRFRLMPCTRVMEAIVRGRAFSAAFWISKVDQLKAAGLKEQQAAHGDKLNAATGDEFRKLLQTIPDLDENDFNEKQLQASNWPDHTDWWQGGNGGWTPLDVPLAFKEKTFTVKLTDKEETFTVPAIDWKRVLSFKIEHKNGPSYENSYDAPELPKLNDDLYGGAFRCSIRQVLSKAGTPGQAGVGQTIPAIPPNPDKTKDIITVATRGQHEAPTDRWEIYQPDPNNRVDDKVCQKLTQKNDLRYWPDPKAPGTNDPNPYSPCVATGFSTAAYQVSPDDYKRETDIVKFDVTQLIPKSDLFRNTVPYAWPTDSFSANIERQKLFNLDRGPGWLGWFHCGTAIAFATPHFAPTWPVFALTGSIAAVSCWNTIAAALGISLFNQSDPLKNVPPVKAGVLMSQLMVAQNKAKKAGWDAIPKPSEVVCNVDDSVKNYLFSSLDWTKIDKLVSGMTGPNAKYLPAQNDPRKPQNNVTIADQLYGSLKDGDVAERWVSWEGMIDRDRHTKIAKIYLKANGFARDVTNWPDLALAVQQFDGTPECTMRGNAPLAVKEVAFFEKTEEPCVPQEVPYVRYTRQTDPDIYLGQYADERLGKSDPNDKTRTMGVVEHTGWYSFQDELVVPRSVKAPCRLKALDPANPFLVEDCQEMADVRDYLDSKYFNRFRTTPFANQPVVISRLKPRPLTADPDRPFQFDTRFDSGLCVRKDINKLHFQVVRKDGDCTGATANRFYESADAVVDWEDILPHQNIAGVKDYLGKEKAGIKLTAFTGTLGNAALRGDMRREVSLSIPLPEGAARYRADLRFVGKAQWIVDTVSKNWRARTAKENRYRSFPVSFEQVRLAMPVGPGGQRVTTDPRQIDDFVNFQGRIYGTIEVRDKFNLVLARFSIDEPNSDNLTDFSTTGQGVAAFAKP